MANISHSPGLLERPVGAPMEEDDGLHEIVLRPSKGWVAVDWYEYYATRELLFSLIGRDLRVRYKQTVLGVGWAVLQPFMTMIIFTLVFGRLLPDCDTSGVPYPLFVYAGLVAWTFFSNAINAAGISLLNQYFVLSKIYFPRAYVPASTVGAAFVDKMIAFALLAVMMLYYRVAPSWQIVFLPVFLAVTFMATLGIGLWTSALVIMFRDIRYLLTFALQILLYLSPVIYSTSFFPAWVRPLLALNPMFGMISAYRSSIFGSPWEWPLVAISTASSAAMFLFGIYFFRRIERHFADIA